MGNPIRNLAEWAPVPAAVSMAVYGIALDGWPLQAGRFFASVFQLDPVTLHPLHGWAAVLPGIALWIAACYTAVAAAWLAQHGLVRLRHLAAVRGGMAAPAARPEGGAAR